MKTHHDAYEHLSLGFEYVATLLRSFSVRTDDIINAIINLGSANIMGVLRGVISTYIISELRRLGISSYDLEVERDEDWGDVYLITINTDAKEALEINLRLQEKFPGIPIVVRWTGLNNVSERELVNYLVEILNRGGFRAKAPKGFNAVKIVRELRER